MAKQGGFLFDEPEPLDPAKCPHARLEPTETVWPNSDGQKRMTMTCKDCGWYRPRWPGEWKL